MLTRLMPSTSLHTPASTSSTGVFASSPNSTRPPSSSSTSLANLTRSTFPFLVNGISSTSFTTTGIMYSGSLPPNALLTSPAPFPLPLTTYATNRLSPPRSCATTTASLTPHSSLIACSTSPHSTLIPLIFTCSSTRPTYSKSPPARYLTKSPVRYILSPGSRLKGSGTNRSAVIPAPFMQPRPNPTPPSYNS